MSTIALNQRKYKRLISQQLPHVIESKEEHEKALNLVYELMTKGTTRSPEETALLKLLNVLISDYERRLNLFPTDDVSPLDVLRHLMESNNHTAKDLWGIADKAVISKILSAERSISKSVAKGLAEFYNVPAGLFI
ncbi:MAG: transcriptional regulator [Candidatus Melainabacteria bacterium]|nr:transcriptional regulator [Candidatus Melainabacteria bacterium]